MKNPFTIGLIEEEADFCNRLQERKELLQYARGGHNVVLYSSRRYGKSSLVKLLKKDLEKEKFLTAYIDLFPISSLQDAAQRMITGLIQAIGKGIDQRSVLEKMKDVFHAIRPVLSLEPEGIKFSVQLSSNDHPLNFLEDLFEGLGIWVEKMRKNAFIIFDEFQEITQLPESKKLEGLMRSKIQGHKEISYFFVGSRRTVLKDIFTTKNRPFYKSAFLYPLGKIPRNEFIDFLMERFQKSGKTILKSLCEEIYDRMQGYPYYVQKFSSLIWDMSADEPTLKTFQDAYEKLLQSEKSDFEAHWSGLTSAQKNFLKTLANYPTAKPFSKNYMKQLDLSTGGAQKVLKVLIQKDLIEKNETGYTLTDPMMIEWLKR